MSVIPQEDVLVVPRALFDQAGAFQGFCGDAAAYLPVLLDPRQTSWRLRAKRSVGIGGHISSTDGEHGDDTSYEAGMRRELAEEIAIGGGWTSRCVGLINDDSNAVGSVHLGIVHVLELERPEVASRESELVECGFATLDALLADRDRFETWSQITLDALRDGTLV
jgi:predicted NUDIX family phosphoesterase